MLVFNISFTCPQYVSGCSPAIVSVYCELFTLFLRSYSLGTSIISSSQYFQIATYFILFLCLCVTKSIILLGNL